MRAPFFPFCPGLSTKAIKLCYIYILQLKTIMKKCACTNTQSRFGVSCNPESHWLASPGKSMTFFVQKANRKRMSYWSDLNWPSGFRWSEHTFAIKVFGAMPAEAVKPLVASRISARIWFTTSSGCKNKWKFSNFWTSHNSVRFLLSWIVNIWIRSAWLGTWSFQINFKDIASVSPTSLLPLWRGDSTKAHGIRQLCEWN